MDTIRIRLARPEDAPRLQALRLAFFQGQILMGLLDVPEDVAAHVTKGTPGILASLRARLYLAEDTAGQLAGYIYTMIKLIPGVRQSSIGSIEEMMVCAERRGTGAADTLLQTALNDLRARDVTRIQLRVLAGNPRGRAFWQRNGFVENLAVLEYPFPASPPASPEASPEAKA